MVTTKYNFLTSKQNKMADKTVVVKERTPQQKKAADNPNRANEPQQTSEPIGESQIGKSALAPEESADTNAATTNQVGQKVDKEITDSNESYVTPDGKIMIVQMKEGNQIFAGEHGKNAHWYPNEVVNSWTKNAKK